MTGAIVVQNQCLLGVGQFQGIRILFSFQFGESGANFVKGVSIP